MRRAHSNAPNISVGMLDFAPIGGIGSPVDALEAGQGVRIRGNETTYLLKI